MMKEFEYIILKNKAQNYKMKSGQIASPNLICGSKFKIHFFNPRYGDVMYAVRYFN